MHVIALQDRVSARLLSMQVRLEALSRSAPATAPAPAALPPASQTPAHSPAVTAAPQTAAPSALELPPSDPGQGRFEAATASTSKSGSRWEAPPLRTAPAAPEVASAVTPAASQLPGITAHVPASETPSSHSPPSSKHRRGFSEKPVPFSMPASSDRPLFGFIPSLGASASPAVASTPPLPDTVGSGRTSPLPGVSDQPPSMPIVGFGSSLAVQNSNKLGPGAAAAPEVSKISWPSLSRAAAAAGSLSASQPQTVQPVSLPAAPGMPLAWQHHGLLQ